MALKERYHPYNDYNIAPPVNNSLTTKFYQFFDLLTVEECAKIVEMADGLELGDGTLGAGADETEQRLDKSYRDVQTNAFPIKASTRWIYDKIRDGVLEANDTCWNFDISGIYEGVQYLEYTEEGHYDWHFDVGVRSSSCRKLTCIVQLSSPDDYEGCDVEIYGGGVIPKEQGSAVVFPSYLYHKVFPLTSGVRRCAVAWIMGPPLR